MTHYVGNNSNTNSMFSSPNSHHFSDVISNTFIIYAHENAPMILQPGLVVS